MGLALTVLQRRLASSVAAIRLSLERRLKRLLVFTERKDTLDFLVGKLANLGFHCCTIHGSMSLEKSRHRLVARRRNA